jgi:DNA polymerase III epsilon subunit-like protein
MEAVKGKASARSRVTVVFILADCETTSLEVPRVLEIAASAFYGDEFTSVFAAPKYMFCALVDPRLGPEPLHAIPANPVHNIDGRLLDLHGAEPFSVVWGRFRNWLARACFAAAASQATKCNRAVAVLTFHNAPFDIGALSHELRILGVQGTAAQDLTSVGVVAVFDTLRMFRHAFRAERPTERGFDHAVNPSDVKLETLDRAFTPSAPAQSHRAAADVEALARVLHASVHFDETRNNFMAWHVVPSGAMVRVRPRAQGK